MEELKSSTPESSSTEGKKEEKEVKEVKVEKEESVELVENNNCLPPAVTMDEMELLKKLEEANRYERMLSTLIRCCQLALRCVNASQNCR